MACLHAHHSNINLIENLLVAYDIQLVHFVDPALLERITSDPSFTKEAAKRHVIEQIAWIAQTNVDAILITCTNYIAFLDEEQIKLNLPVFKIDEPLFEEICQYEAPQQLLFTNPATVEGTMNRLYQYSRQHQRTINVEAILLPELFGLVLSGQNEIYNDRLRTALQQTLESNKRISVAQLSMVTAAKEVEKQTMTSISNPLDLLAHTLIKKLDLKPALLFTEEKLFT